MKSSIILNVALLFVTTTLFGAEPTCSGFRIVESSSWFAVSPQKPTVTVAVDESINDDGGSLRFIVLDDGSKSELGEDNILLVDYYKRVGLNQAGTFVDFTADVPPGFYKCLVIANQVDTLGSFNIGYNPEDIVSPVDSSADFEQFWQTSLSELNSVKPKYRLTLIKDKSSAMRKTYLVEMKSWGGETIRGYYVCPTKEGKYPMIIYYMGYGSKPWNPDPNGNGDWCEFVLSVRGQGLNEPENSYGYWATSGLESKDSYYYRGAFMDVVRAVDFACSRDEVDQSTIFAAGGSQGGAFTLVACALDGRISGAAPTIPFLSDYPDYFKVASWPGNMIIEKHKELGMADDALYSTLSYFDVKNFASKIKCPVIMGFGLQDHICPPHINFAGYNLITAPKEYVCYSQHKHDVGDDWWDIQMKFFTKLKKCIKDYASK